MAGITDKEVRALIAKAKASGKVATQADGMVPGLTLTASKTGVGSWVLRYRTGGKQKETTIGKFPAWGAADAREKARSCAGLLMLALTWLSKSGWPRWKPFI
ncbi:MAG: DUF4102 domain-containing protein [Betaproteobacteria bacterium]|nr:DUF4102 domain-containing protein [Betaproteobacteria bacterium]